MRSDFSPVLPAYPGLELVQTVVRAALLEVAALVRVNRVDAPIFEPDPWSHEAPFLSPEWPRS